MPAPEKHTTRHASRQHRDKQDGRPGGRSQPPSATKKTTDSTAQEGPGCTDARCHDPSRGYSSGHGPSYTPEPQDCTEHVCADFGSDRTRTRTREPQLLGTCSTGVGPGPGPWSSTTRSGARMGDVGRLFCVAKGGGNPSNFCGRSSPAWRGTGAPSIRQPRPSPSLSTAGTPFSLPQRPLNGTVAPSAPPHRGSRCSRATHASLRASNSCASKRPLGAPGRTRPRALSLIRQAERSTAGLVGIDKGEDGACERRERG